VAAEIVPTLRNAGAHPGDFEGLVFMFGRRWRLLFPPLHDMRRGCRNDFEKARADAKQKPVVECLESRSLLSGSPRPGFPAELPARFVRLIEEMPAPYHGGHPVGTLEHAALAVSEHAIMKPRSRAKQVPLPPSLMGPLDASGQVTIVGHIFPRSR
jgi:hypothetical protein